MISDGMTTCGLSALANPDHRIPRVSNERLGLRLPRPLAAATVDQRLHHVVRLDTGSNGVGYRFNSPHGQILQFGFRTLFRAHEPRFDDVRRQEPHLHRMGSADRAAVASRPQPGALPRYHCPPT